MLSHFCTVHVHACSIAFFSTHFTSWCFGYTCTSITPSWITLLCSSSSSSELTQIIADVCADPTLPRTTDHPCPKYVLLEWMHSAAWGHYFDCQFWKKQWVCRENCWLFSLNANLHVNIWHFDRMKQFNVHGCSHLYYNVLTHFLTRCFLLYLPRCAHKEAVFFQSQSRRAEVCMTAISWTDFNLACCLMSLSTYRILVVWLSVRVLLWSITFHLRQTFICVKKRRKLVWTGWDFCRFCSGISGFWSCLWLCVFGCALQDGMKLYYVCTSVSCGYKWIQE